MFEWPKGPGRKTNDRADNKLANRTTLQDAPKLPPVQIRRRRRARVGKGQIRTGVKGATKWKAVANRYCKVRG